MASRDYSVVAVLRLRIGVASLVVEHTLYGAWASVVGLSDSRVWAQ